MLQHTSKPLILIGVMMTKSPQMSVSCAWRVQQMITKVKQHMTWLMS